MFPVPHELDCGFNKSNRYFCIGFVLSRAGLSRKAETCVDASSGTASVRACLNEQNHCRGPNIEHRMRRNNAFDVFFFLVCFGSTPEASNSEQKEEGRQKTETANTLPSTDSSTNYDAQSRAVSCGVLLRYSSLDTCLGSVRDMSKRPRQ